MMIYSAYAHLIEEQNKEFKRKRLVYKREVGEKLEKYMKF